MAYGPVSDTYEFPVQALFIYMQLGQHEIQEEKKRKVIGYATLLNEAVRKTIPNFEQYLDLAKYSLKERLEIFRGIPGLVEGELKFENITPRVGFTQILKAMTGNLASLADLIVNYHALGTGTTGATLSDTQLQIEGTRKLLASTSYDATNSRMVFTAFYTASEAVGTWQEMGLFINGSATVNSGYMWDRSVLPIVKTNTQALTIDYEDTLVNG